MKKIFFVILSLFMLNTNAFADESNDLIASAAMPVNPQMTQTAPVRASVTQCYDTLIGNTEQLFYLTLAALNTMNFKVKEIQSKTGTVLFQAYSKEFLITIADKGSNNIFIKILPTDSNYSFSPALVQNIFNFLKANAGVTPTVL